MNISWVGWLITENLSRVLPKLQKPLTLLTQKQVKFDWMPLHHTTFLTLKEVIIQAPILHYPDPNRKYIVYTDASDDACGAQLSQEHDGMEFPTAFLSHMFTETQKNGAQPNKKHMEFIML